MKLWHSVKLSDIMYKKSGKTEEQICDTAGIDIKEYRKLTRHGDDTVELRQLYGLCYALGVSPNEFLHTSTLDDTFPLFLMEEQERENAVNFLDVFNKLNDKGKRTILNFMKGQVLLQENQEEE